MTTWTSGELTTIGTADEVQVAALRRDGTPRAPRIVWVVRLGDDLYVRSVNGSTAAWFQGVQARPEGRVQGGGVAKDVTFAAADPGLNDQIDTAYQVKYRRYPSPVKAITSQQARATTLRLVPR
jgi:hypothetical protein